MEHTDILQNDFIYVTNKFPNHMSFKNLTKHKNTSFKSLLCNYDV